MCSVRCAVRSAVCSMQSLVLCAMCSVRRMKCAVRRVQCAGNNQSSPVERAAQRWAELNAGRRLASLGGVSLGVSGGVRTGVRLGSE